MFCSRCKYVSPKVHQLVAFRSGGTKRRLVQTVCAFDALHIAELASVLLYVMLVRTSVPSAVSDENHYHGDILGADVGQTTFWLAVVLHCRSDPRCGLSAALSDQWRRGWQVQQYYGIAIGSTGLLYLGLRGGIFRNGSEEFECVDLDAQYSVVHHWHLCGYGTFFLFFLSWLDCFITSLRTYSLRLHIVGVFSTVCTFRCPNLFPSNLPFQISCYMRDLEPIRAKGFLTGYNEFVWMVILLQAAGGLVSVAIISLSFFNSFFLLNVGIHSYHICF